MALGFRQILVAAISVVGGVALARLLTPAQFGLYAVFVFALSVLGTFGDVGLGASLVRSPSEPSTNEYRVVFTAQQGLLAIGILALFLAAPLIAAAYRLPPDDAWLFRLVALSLVPASLQVIPSIRLERDLRFERLAAVEVSQTVVYYATAVILVVLGFGVWGLAVAIIARSTVGALLVNLASPWPIGFSWDPELVRRHMGFGLPYQASSWVSLAKDSMNPVLVGLLLGAAQVGYLNWALALAAYPVLALMMLQRLYLPAFSKMQQHPDELGPLVAMVVRGTNTIVAPLAVLCLVLVIPITTIVFGDKWLPAIPFFYFLWTANLFVATATPLYGLLNALGRSRTALGFALLWMVSTWVFGLPLIAAFGPIGFAAGNALVQLTNFLLYMVARRAVPLSLLPAVLPPWAIAFGVGLLVAIYNYIVPIANVVVLGVVGLVGMAVYAAATAAIYPADARKAWALIREKH
jgi:O-antigen/teichoic acid export membrane protein